MVAGAAGRGLPGPVAQVLVQLRSQRRLDHPARELRNQAAGAGDLLGLKALQRLLELLGRQQAGEPVNDLPGRPVRRAGRRTSRPSRTSWSAWSWGRFPAPPAAVRSPPRPTGFDGFTDRGGQGRVVTPTSHRRSDRTGKGMLGVCHVTTVKSILVSARISGQRAYESALKSHDGPNGREIPGPGNWEAIIRPEETTRIRAMLGQP